jgi:integrase
MNMKKNDKGKWDVRLSLGTDARGKRVQKYLSADTKQELRAKASAFEQAYANGEIAVTSMDRGKMTVQALLDEYLFVHADNFAINTKRNYGALADCITSHLGTYDVNRLTTRDVETYLKAVEAERSLKGTSLNQRARLLRSAYKYAHKVGYTKNEAVSHVESRKRVKERRHLWNLDKLHQFLDVARERSPYWVAFVLLVASGARKNEIKGLTWDCVNFEEGYIRINKSATQLSAKQQEELRTDKLFRFTPTKTGRDRDIYLDEGTLQDLKRWRVEQTEMLLKIGERPEDDLVCTTKFGRYICNGKFHDEYRRLCKRADVVPIRIHDLRHLHATILINDEVNVKVVQDRLGHASIGTTLDIYAHVTTDKQKDAATSFGAQLRPKKNANVQ